MVAKWKKEGHYDQKAQDLWNDYVPKHLLPRLYGFELMMAPYAIAHMKVGLKLFETGYRFGADERARIYLTNSLEPPGEVAPDLPFDSSAIAHEALAVKAVKESVPFTVVMGNPPYSGISANMQPAIRQSIDPYRSVDGNIIKEKGALQFEKNLNDDYVKFLRFAESKIESNVGMMGLITNNAYLESTTLRGLRAHLLDTFSLLWFLDLHGDADKRETTDDGQPDENVFDIKHGVAVSVLVKMPPAKEPSHKKGAAFRDDLKGCRKSKYPWLLSHTVTSGAWAALRPRPDRYQFAKEDHSLAVEYEQHISVKDMLDVNSTGFESGRDEILTAFTKEELRVKLEYFCKGSPQEIKSTFNVAKAWGEVLYNARHSIIKDPDFESRFLRFLFNPFDIRWCFFRKDLLKTNSFSAGKHLCYGSNIALMVMRQVSLDSGFTHVGVSKYIVNNRCFYSTKGKVSYFPIDLYSEQSDLVHQQGELLGPNLRTGALEKYARSLKLKWANPRSNDQHPPGSMTVRDVANYSFATFHSPTYRSRYEEFLKIDFPRIPLTSSLPLFRSLAKLGSELVALHLVEFLLEDEKPKNAAEKAWPVYPRLTEFTGKVPSLEIEKVSYAKKTVWLDKAQSTGFKGVPEEVWNFHIGGYQVCEKWLKDRKGRRLSADDVLHYHKIVTALSNTIRLMKEIDAVIEKHGGWPGAFQGQP
jgi:predicted helicase